MKKFKLFLFSTFFLPVASFAAIVPPCVTEPLNASSTGGSGLGCGFSDLVGMFNNFINWFLGISAVLATITCVYAAVKILSHPSNPGERTKALAMFGKALAGIAIVLLAWLVMKTVITALVNPSTDALRFFSN